MEIVLSVIFFYLFTYNKYVGNYFFTCQTCNILFSDDWLNLIEECLSHEAIVIRNKAVSALTAVFNEYLNYDSVKIALSHSVENENMKENLQSKRKELIEKYCKQLKNTSSYGLHIRMGYSLAIGMKLFYFYFHYSLRILRFIF